MRKVKVAIAGIGNCASNFIQGIEYYKQFSNEKIGLVKRKLGNYDVSDIEVVAAFDISKNKVGKKLSDAIFSFPNNTEKIVDMINNETVVNMGPVLDRWGEHFKDFIEISSEKPVKIEEVLTKNKVDILVIMLPTGSDKACKEYVKAALKAGVNVINGTPTFISNNNDIVREFENKKLALIGDDFKSQIGGTILHHTLLKLLEQRGVSVDNSYHINYAGNMDFYNLITKRGEKKHISKKNGIKSLLNKEIDLSVNVTYIKNQRDNKTCRIYIEGKNFGGCPVTLEGKLTVVDSANSSGVLIDAIRYLKISIENGNYGYLEIPSACFMKSPRKHMLEEEAYSKFYKFIESIEEK